jgi:hypothetical protein
MMRNKRLSSKEIRKVLSFPKCQVDGKISSMAHIDVCSARIKGGGIHVTVYPTTNVEIKGPREVRQKLIMDSDIRKDTVDFAQKRKNKLKAKKKPLSSEKYLPERASFVRI